MTGFYEMLEYMWKVTIKNITPMSNTNLLDKVTSCFFPTMMYSNLIFWNWWCQLLKKWEYWNINIYNLIRCWKSFSGKTYRCIYRLNSIYDVLRCYLFRSIQCVLFYVHLSHVYVTLHWLNYLYRRHSISKWWHNTKIYFLSLFLTHLPQCI